MQMAKIETWSEFEAASAELRRKWIRDWLARCQENYLRKCQLDAEADQRAFERGHSDLEPGPIDKCGEYAGSGTSRTPSYE
jgi:hypothetical protein